MGDKQSRESKSGSRTSGMVERCYQVGYDHGSATGDPSPVADGVEAFPCTLKEKTNKSYAKGYTDGMKARRDNHYSTSNSSYRRRR